MIAATVASRSGAALITPCDDAGVIAGQGTVARELIEKTGPLDVLLVSVGGGGLMAGSAVAAKAMLPAIRVIGVEPRQGNDMQLSLAAGRRVTISPPTTILDGQVNTAPARLSFEINQKLSDGIVLVDDHEVVDAMALLFDRLKVVAEPSGAAPLAALVSGKVEAAGRRVGVILSGGNIGIDRFCTLMSQLATPIRE